MGASRRFQSAVVTSALAWTGLGSVTVAASGCGPYIDDVNEQHREKLEAKLQQIAKLDAAVKATPRVERNVPTQRKLSLSLHPLHQASDDAALIYAEDLENLDEQGPVSARLRLADLIPECSAGLHTERKPWQSDAPGQAPYGLRGVEAAEIYPACERLEVVLVLRTRAFAKPELLPVLPLAASAGPDAGDAEDAGSDASEADAEAPDAARGKPAKPAKATRPARPKKLDAGIVDAGTDADSDGGRDARAPVAPVERYRFMGGYLDAEVLVFELAGPRLVGAFRFEAESSPKVEGYARGREVFEDFEGRIYGALRKAMNENAPDSFRLTVGAGK